MSLKSIRGLRSAKLSEMSYIFDQPDDRELLRQADQTLKQSQDFRLYDQLLIQQVLSRSKETTIKNFSLPSNESFMKSEENEAESIIGSGETIETYSTFPSNVFSAGELPESLPTPNPFTFKQETVNNSNLFKERHMKTLLEYQHIFELMSCFQEERETEQEETPLDEEMYLESTEKSTYEIELDKELEDLEKVLNLK